MNKQRETIYKQRREILQGKDMKEYVLELVETLVDWQMDQYTNKDKDPDEWDVPAFEKAVGAQFGVNLEDLKIDWPAVSFDGLREKILGRLLAAYREKERLLGPDHMREFERIILLQVIDTQWKDHLLGMDYLKEGIGLRGYGQRDPLIEYKKESYDMFQAMLDRIEDDTIRYLFLIQPVTERQAGVEMPQRRQTPMYYRQPQQASGRKAQQARSLIPKKRKKK
jgi:preprotein translocase subunit SecA